MKDINCQVLFKNVVVASGGISNGGASFGLTSIFKTYADAEGTLTMENTSFAHDDIVCLVEGDYIDECEEAMLAGKKDCIIEEREYTLLYS